MEAQMNYFDTRAIKVNRMPETDLMRAYKAHIEKVAPNYWHSWEAGDIADCSAMYEDAHDLALIMLKTGKKWKRMNGIDDNWVVINVTDFKDRDKNWPDFLPDVYGGDYYFQEGSQIFELYQDLTASTKINKEITH